MYTHKYCRTGETLYLHRQLSKSKKSFVWYFNRDSQGAVELPQHFEVIESPRSGYPLVRKKKAIGG